MAPKRERERRAQSKLHQSMSLTYGDLVRRFVELSQTEGPFQQAPFGRYVNSLSDYLSAEKGSTHSDAINAWRTLKGFDIPKTFAAWKNIAETTFDELVRRLPGLEFIEVAWTMHTVPRPNKARI